MEEKKIRFVSNHLPPFYTIITERNVTRVEGWLSFIMDFMVSAFKMKLVMTEFRKGMMPVPNLLVHVSLCDVLKDYFLRDLLRYEIVKETDVGVEISKGNWTGCVGRLHRNEADIYAGHFSADPHLFPYVGFSNSFEDVTASVLSGPPIEVGQRATSLLSSLDVDVWVCLFLSWTLVSCLYYAFVPLESKLLQRPLPEETLTVSILTFYGLLFQRGFENLPVTPSLRLLASGWLVFVIVFSTDIGGTFSSKLAVTDAPIRINSLSDILKYPKIKPYVPSGIMIDAHIMNADSTSMQDVWRQIKKHEGVQPPSLFFGGSIIEDVLRGKAVVISYRDPMLSSFVTYTCRQRIRAFYVAREQFFSLPVVFLYRKGLDPKHVETLNRMSIVHASSGYGMLNWRLANQFALPCFQEAFAKEGHKALTLNDVMEVFRILLIGNGTSCIVCFLENLHKLWRFKHSLSSLG